MLSFPGPVSKSKQKWEIEADVQKNTCEHLMHISLQLPCESWASRKARQEENQYVRAVELEEAPPYSLDSKGEINKQVLEHVNTIYVTKLSLASFGHVVWRNSLEKAITFRS